MFHIILANIWNNFFGANEMKVMENKIEVILQSNTENIQKMFRNIGITNQN